MIIRESDLINENIKHYAGANMSDEKVLEIEIKNFKKSKKLKNMITGMKYADGEHDILNKKRTAIGADGDLQIIENLPNNRIVDNQYLRMLSQKVNYILGKPLTVDSEDETYKELLSQIINKSFNRTLKRVCEDAYNCGVGFLYVRRDKDGKLAFKRFNPTECVPVWEDSEHTKLEMFARLYKVAEYEGETVKATERVEVYTRGGIVRYIYSNGQLLEDIENPGGAYYNEVDEYGKSMEYPWLDIPVIAFKYNAKEIPLINKVKCLQDAINTIESMYLDTSEEDSGNTILVLKNYDGENLGEFRRNLAEYRAIKVRSTDGMQGGVETISVKVNPENYKTVLSLLKQALIENAMGYDAKDDRLAGNPNQMNIQSMYSDIDLDTNNLETEFQASLEELLVFIDLYLLDTDKGDYRSTQADFIFTRDIMMNQTEAIQNVIASSAVLSKETTISKHPWVVDVGQELERLKAESEEAQEGFGLGDDEGNDE